MKISRSRVDSSNNNDPLPPMARLEPRTLAPARLAAEEGGLAGQRRHGEYSAALGYYGELLLPPAPSITTINEK